MRGSLQPPFRAAAAWLLAGLALFTAAPATAEDDLLAALQAAYAQAVKPGEQADTHRELLASVLGRVQRSYVKEVHLPSLAAAALTALQSVPPGTGEPAEVFTRAVNQALRTLDPYSRYLNPLATASDRNDSTGTFVGLGLELESRDGLLRIVSPLPGSPAERAGLRPGDFIVQVDDVPLAGVPLPEATSRLRGAPGTPVSLTVRRNGESSEFTLSITREMVRRQVLRSSLDGDVLVLRLSAFTSSIATMMERGIAHAASIRPVRGVVLDMRGNGGGLVREAVLVADAFLTQGEIVSMQGRPGAPPRSWQSDPNEVLPGVPMVVLMDARSASAAELVAAALQDNGRAVVMGQRSYGKGTVQTTYSLGEQKGALKLTTSVYVGPSGRSVQKVGVTPDIELVTPDDKRTPEADAAAPAMRVEQARCAGLRPSQDPALSCAMAYLLAGSVPAFSAVLAETSP